MKTSSAPIKLYGSGPSRWVKPFWLLREMDVPFEAIKVSLAQGEHRKPEFLKLNPFAKVPALEHGDVHLFESTAICNYLADQFPAKRMIPTAGTKDRGLCDQWTSFATTELEQPLWRIIKHKFIYPEANRSAADIDLAVVDFKKLCKTFNEQLTSSFLVGESISVADISIIYTLKWAKMPSMPPGLLDEFAELCAYMDKHMARPSFPTELYRY